MVGGVLDQMKIMLTQPKVELEFEKSLEKVIKGVKNDFLSPMSQFCFWLTWIQISTKQI